VPENENITVLFTDLVGSTELASSMTPEAADEIRRGHFSALRQAVAEAGGTEIKNLGDGIMVTFPTASAALSCGVAIQQAVDRDNRGLERPLGVRVGLSGGEATKEADDYFGDPVIEAARLCAKAEGGQILAADLVRATAGRRNRHECRSLGELTLKGLPDPVAIVEVLWQPLGGTEAGTSLPMPGRLSVRPGPGVVGREAELTQINDTFKRVSAGGGREVLLVSGEAGMGKTTLVAEASRSAFNGGAIVLYGHCEEDLAAPYQLFSESLGHFVSQAPRDQLFSHVSAYGSELSKLTPALVSRVPDLPPSKAIDSDTERFLLFSAVVGLLATMSEIQPVVLVLDDLQWADKGSLLLFRHMVASDEAMRVLILGVYRDSELAHGHALTDTLAALHRHSGVTRIELTGLDDDGVMALMEAIAGYTLDDAAADLAHAVYRETDGNPFFVTEVLRHLAETGAIYQDASGRWVGSEALEQIALPDSVRMVLGARVERLGSTVGRVLSVAAVIGRDFDVDVLALATKTSEDDLLDILEAAAAAALVREPADSSGRYSFAHALIQHTLYGDLGPNRRSRAHRVVAEALEKLCGDRPGKRVGELARHWVSATQPIDLTKAIRYSQRAGDAALAALAPSDALRYYAQALDLSAQVEEPDPVLDVDLAIGLGTAQRQTGNPAFRDTLLNASRTAASLANTDRLVAAALANDRGMLSTAGAVDADKVEILKMALSRLPADHPDRALVLGTLCSEVVVGSSLEGRQSLANEAVAIAEASGDDVTIVRVLNHIYVPLMVPSLLEQSLVWTTDALVRAERIGDPVLLLFAAMWCTQNFARVGDIHEMDRCLEIVGSVAEQVDQPIFKWGHAAHCSLRAQIAGDTVRAEQFATTAFEVASQAGQPDAFIFFAFQLGIVNLQRGTLGDLVPLIEQIGAENADANSALVGAFLALAHAEADRTGNASHLLEEFLAGGVDLAPNNLWLTAMVAYADAAITLGDPNFAGPLFDQLAPWAEQCSSAGPTAEGPVSCYLGGLATVMGRYDEADAFFAQSAGISSRMGAKFFVARTNLLWGKMLAERKATGDVDRARELLIRARTAAVELGYGNVERRAAEALQG
jgi:class 3 adenylate cyclase